MSGTTNGGVARRPHFQGHATTLFRSSDAPVVRKRDAARLQCRVATARPSAMLSAVPYTQPPDSPPLHSRHKRPHEAFSFGLVDIRHRPHHPLYDRAPELLIFVAFSFSVR